MTTRCYVCGQEFAHLGRYFAGVWACSYACQDSAKGDEIRRAFAAYLATVTA